MKEQTNNTFFRKNFPGYFVTADKMRIFFTTNFSHTKKSSNDCRPTLVFNYGLVCSNAHWQHQLSFFDELDYNIIIYDYRGHYNSSKIFKLKEDCTFLKMVQDLYELILFLKKSEIIMLGHSMGVNISLQFALSYPQLLHKMILISGSIIPPEEVMLDSHIITYIRPTLKFVTDKFPTTVGDLWKNAFMNPLIKRGIHIGGFNTKKVPEQFVELYLKRIGQLEPQLFFQLFQEMHDHKIINDLPNIKTPSLIIAGDEDKVIPLHIQTLLQKKLPVADIYQVRNGSHVPQADFPQTVNDKILQFIINQ